MWVRIPSLEPFTTSQQSTQLSTLPRSVNEYSEVTLRAQALDRLITANLKLKCKDSELLPFIATIQHGKENFWNIGNDLSVIGYIA